MKSTTIAATCISLCSLFLATSARGDEGEIIPLWKDGAPGFEDRKDEEEVVERGSVTNVHYPTLAVFRPSKEKANGVAIVIAPGAIAICPPFL